MDELISKKLEILRHKLETISNNLDIDKIRKNLVMLEEQMSSADFWNNTSNAEVVSKQAAQDKQYLQKWDGIFSDIDTALELLSMASEDESDEYAVLVEDIIKRGEELIFDENFSGEYDNNAAIMQLSAGVGGTDAADWTEMLERMYLKYASATGLNPEILEESFAEEAGIKSATIRFSGPFAYGKLRSERGVHRLVRLSPFNSDNLRQTSFALIEIIPEQDEAKFDISESDLKIDTYRSSGKGGQGVNTTDSAVRVTHLPTGTVVSIQSERSQLKNKQRAISILASRLSQIARDQHLNNINELKSANKSADWGSQIRSYVLQPYQKVKDHRTNYETSDVQSVLDGELQGFVEAYLSSQKN